MFPFAALVGLETLKLALQLAAIDHRLSVLVRGDKGAGKSTAARGLAELLPAARPFVTLPIGATEDRLLGGLDVEKALKGEPSLKPGLLAEANGGVLYIDEVNLLPDHLADALLDAVASGVHIVEREGFSARQAADFVLLGSMNPEEGALRPQLLDRFALAVDVEAPMDPAMRCEVLERRLAFDRDPEAFCAILEEDAGICGVDWPRHRRESASVGSARDAALRRDASRRTRRQVTARGSCGRARQSCPCRTGRRGRGDVRARRDGASAGTGASDAPGSRPPEESAAADARRPVTRQTVHNLRTRQTASASSSQTTSGAARRGRERVCTRRQRRRTWRAHSGAGHRFPPLRRRRVSWISGRVVHAVTHSGTARLRVEDLHEPVRAPRASTRFILIVDSSGSHAIHDRMRLVKGAVSGLLEASHGRHDEVVVIACRGAEAHVLVEPTSSRDDADRALEYLPTGGRTPLAHGLELAAGYVTDQRRGDRDHGRARERSAPQRRCVGRCARRRGDPLPVARHRYGGCAEPDRPSAETRERDARQLRTARGAGSRPSPDDRRGQP